MGKKKDCGEVANIIGGAHPISIGLKECCIVIPVEPVFM